LLLLLLLATAAACYCCCLLLLLLLLCSYVLLRQNSLHHVRLNKWHARMLNARLRVLRTKLLPTAAVHIRVTLADYSCAPSMGKNKCKVYTPPMAHH
jgi:hypothetical protein